MRRFFVIAFVLLLQGCVSMVDSGREFPMSEVSALVVGETTRAEVVELFGEPVTITEKIMDNTVIYSYMDSLNRGVTLGIPPVFTYSWRSGKGTTLNIVFRDGIYRGHEVITRQ